MANILEYVLSLKDQTSKTLAVIGVNSDKVLNKFAALEKQTFEVKDSLSQFKNSVGSLREKLALLKNERDWIPREEIKTIRAYNSEINKLTKEINKLETINGSKFKVWAKDAFESLPDFAKNPIVAMGAVIGTSLKKSMDAGMSKMQLQVMTDDNIGERLYGDLTKFANDTVFGSEVYEQAASMLGNGFSDSEVMPIMQMLGDVSRGSAEKLQSLTYAMGQVKGAGKLVGNDLIQLQNAGFYPLAEIAKKTGETVTQVKERMSKGKVTYDEVRGALESMTGPGGKFHDMLKKIAETPYGKLQQLQGTLDTLMINIGNIFMPIASLFMTVMSLGLDIVSKGLGKFIDLFKGMIAELQAGNPIIWGLVAVISALTLGYAIHTAWLQRAIIWQKLKITWDKIATVVTGGLAGAMAVLNAVLIKNPITWVILIIMILVGTISILIYALDGWKQAWEHLMNGIKIGITGAKEWLELTWLRIEDTFLSGFAKIEKGWYKVKSLWNKKSTQEAISKLDTEAELRKQKIDNQKLLVDGFADAQKEQFSKIFGKDGLHYNGKLKGVMAKIKSPSSIIPGIVPENNPLAEAGTGGVSPTSKTNEAIATGGTKNTTINITIGNLVKDFKVTASGIAEANDKVMDNIIEAVSRAVSIGAALGN